MTNSTEGFEQLGPYYDDKNYPRGFNKSGEFTTAEANLLQQYGKHLNRLAQGKCDAANAQQQQFVKVCRGEQSAQTAVEKAWCKYQAKINAPRRAISAYSSSRPQDDFDIPVEVDDLGDFDD